MVDTSL
jgi:protein transport protein SEC23